MANTQPHPISNFNFAIEINVTGVSPKVCEAAFSECDGLEMNQEIKTLREGGNNTRQYRLAGPLAYGNLTLKRGVTKTYDLWDWFTAVTDDPKLRADAQVIVYAADGSTVHLTFKLTRCIPIKLKAPSLNAASSGIAIEEFQLAYETLSLEKPR
jgi:phage tail-like protein